MKLNTAFIASPRAALRSVLAAVWLATLVLCAAAGYVAWQAKEQRAQLPQLRMRLATLQRRAATPVALPPAAQLQALQQRVSAINALAGGARGSLPRLLAELEQQLPEPVWLLSLHYRPRSGELALVAEAESAEPLTRFLLALEQSPRFAQVLLTRQAPQSDTLRFELRLVERR